MNTEEMEALAYAKYAEKFDDKAAKRNPGRISRLADLIKRYGSDNLVNIQVINYKSSQEFFCIKRENEEGLLGNTNTNSSGSGYAVVANFGNSFDTQSDAPTERHMA